MRKSTLFVVTVLLALAIRSQGATYYVDYSAGSDANNGVSKTTSWQRAPGMTGFAGKYVHSAGDIFIFRGGVTWPAAAMPLNVVGSGSAAAWDKYGSDSSWYSGTTFSQPVFDGGGNGGFLFEGTNRNYLIIDGLRFQNAGVSGQNNKDTAVGFDTCSHVAVRNSVFVTYTWIGVDFYYGTANTNSQDIEIANNDFSNVSMAVVVSTAAASAIADNVRIHDNKIHDFASKIGSGVHGDGVHIWGDPSDPTQYVTNLRIYNNLFYGSFRQTFGTGAGMTAFIFIEDATQGALIYNNVGTYNDPPSLAGFGALIMTQGHAGRGGSHSIFNNTLFGTSPGVNAAIFLFSSPNCIVKNNAVGGAAEAFDADAASTPGTTLDYDDWNTTSPSSDVGEWPDGTPLGWSAWQAKGLDMHGTIANPQFIGAGDFHLQSSSPLIGAGANLSTAFNIDKDNNPRPVTGSWTVGAYEGSSSTARPNPPSNVSTVVH